MNSIIKNNTISTAVIMAAGIGSRFGQYTKDIPKGFVLFSGKEMIFRSIENLIQCGFKRIIIGTGYKKEFYEALANKYSQIECCFNPLYENTNSMYTLYNCLNLVGTDNFLLLESDIIYEKKAITFLLDSMYEDIMLVSELTKIQDQYFVEINNNNELINCSTNENILSPFGELVGIHKISNEFFQKMCKDYQNNIEKKYNLGYEYQILSISQKIQPMKVLKIDNLIWYEIDDELDLIHAEEKYSKFLS